MESRHSHKAQFEKIDSVASGASQSKKFLGPPTRSVVSRADLISVRVLEGLLLSKRHSFGKRLHEPSLAARLRACLVRSAGRVHRSAQFRF